MFAKHAPCTSMPSCWTACIRRLRTVASCSMRSRLLRRVRSWTSRLCWLVGFLHAQGVKMNFPISGMLSTTLFDLDRPNFFYGYQEQPDVWGAPLLDWEQPDGT